jgi:hypothetical protein
VDEPATLGLNTVVSAGPIHSHDHQYWHDFSRIPVLAQSDPAVQAPGIADTLSEAFAKSAENETRDGLGRFNDTERPDLVGQMIGEPEGSVRALTPQERRVFEPRFGHDFSRVKLHFDSDATEVARDLNADAFTVGANIFFGSSVSNKHDLATDQIMFHELAHVVQQSRDGIAIQPKLKLTGMPDHVARVIALLNSGLQGWSVGQTSGQVFLTQTASIPKPTEQQTALASRLHKIILDSKDVLITVSAGSRTLGGTYRTKDIDIADLEVYGVAGLIHEIEEQYQGQTKGYKSAGTEKQGPHSEGIKAESEVMGATRGPQKVISKKDNADGSIDAVLEIPYTFPGGNVRVKVMKVVNSNIVSFEWK